MLKHIFVLLRVDADQPKPSQVRVSHFLPCKLFHDNLTQLIVEHELGIESCIQVRIVE